MYSIIIYRLQTTMLIRLYYYVEVVLVLSGYSINLLLSVPGVVYILQYIMFILYVYVYIIMLKLKT